MSEHAKHAVDALAVGGTVATMIDWLPDIAAGLSVIWLLMRIYDWISSKLKPKD